MVLCFLCFLFAALTNSSVFAIDYFDEEIISARLECSAIIEADCTYHDYENSVWDAEEKEYIFLNTVRYTEIHDATFACAVQINREYNSIDFVKFHVFLGGDTFVERQILSSSSNAYNTCPDCGKEISFESDGGNGFCINCASNH